MRYNNILWIVDRISIESLYCLFVINCIDVKNFIDIGINLSIVVSIILGSLVEFGILVLKK